MKVLNLDKLVPNEGRELVIAGVTYPVLGMTVGNFIQTTRAAEKMGENTSIADQIEATVEMILRSVPSIPREVLAQLSLEQLQTIVAFVRGDAVDGVEAEQGAEGGEGK